MPERTPTAHNSSLPPPFQRKAPLLSPARHPPSVKPHKLIAHSYLNGKHVVFGEVLEGYEIVEKIEDVPKGPGDKPSIKVTIVKSGELPVPEEGIHVEL